ncbi:MAG: hypothetical protein H5T98_04185 [Syntrophomonadaceae bacterium]|nr:hypothetical protein [Syntrophomonadaceae bacterium]
MMIVRKFLFGFVFFSVFLNFLPVAFAGQVEWSIIWDDSDCLLQEKVTADSAYDFSVDAEEWNYSRSGEKVVISRTVENWQTYNTLSDRFPLEARVKNFLIFKTISLKGEKNNDNAHNLYSQLISSDNMKLIIKIPGIIRECSADQIEDYSCIWNLYPSSGRIQNDIMLQAVVPEGFYLGLSIFTIGFLIIAFGFLRCLKKVNKIIEEEYSLEKAREEIEAGSREEGEAKEDK